MYIPVWYLNVMLWLACSMYRGMAVCSCDVSLSQGVRHCFLSALSSLIHFILSTSIRSLPSSPSLFSSSPSFALPVQPSSLCWSMHEGGFPEDQRAHYPGVIRLQVEHVKPVTLFSHWQTCVYVCVCVCVCVHVCDRQNDREKLFICILCARWAT